MQPKVTQPTVPCRARGHQLKQQEGHRGLQWCVPTLQPWLQGPWGHATALDYSQSWSFPTMPTMPTIPTISTILVDLSQCCLLFWEPAWDLLPNAFLPTSSPLPALCLIPVLSLSLGEIFS